MKEFGNVDEEAMGIERGFGEEGDGVGGGVGKKGHFFVVEIVDNLVELFFVSDGDGCGVHNCLFLSETYII